MLYTRITRLALCLLVELSRHRKGFTPVSTIDAAENGRPRQDLSKLLGKLQTAGIVEGRRGVKGGFRIPAPNKVTIAMVRHLLEGPIEWPKKLPANLRRGIQNYLDETTIASLARR